MRFSFLIFLSLLYINSFAQNGLSDSYEEQMAWRYIVIAGISSDFNALDILSKRISIKSGIEYSNDLIYVNKRGMIEPDTSHDETYAGTYYPRRYDTSRISIEMMWYYSDDIKIKTDTTQMIIITGIFDSKKFASNQLKNVKQIVPAAYIKKIQMYMGCMH